MLREIFSSGFVEKNTKNNERKKMMSGKKREIKKRSYPSFKGLNCYSPKNDFYKYDNTRPIMGKKIDIIMNRPDYLLAQNDESTLPTSSINKQYIYSNEVTKNLMTLKDNENLNMNDNTSNQKSINANNNSNIEANSDEKNTKPNNNINNDVVKEINKSEIIIPEMKAISNSAFIQNNQIQNTSGNKSKTENNKSYEFNMSLLSSEGIDKLRLLEEYITQIKENSTNSNEIKLQQLQKQKTKLENKVNILANNIRLGKKKYKDNINLKKNLELEKERARFDNDKANVDAFALMKELPNNRVEIEVMKNQIAQTKEETKGINNYANDIERQTMEIQDELKKINVKITNIIKEKDKISNEINAIYKKCSMLRIKIDKAEKSANDFLYNVGELAKLIQQNNI